MNIKAQDIARMIDLSCVRAASTLDEIQEMANIAMQYGCICTFALPAHTPLLIDLLKQRDDILIGGTVGFPSGASTTACKVAEAVELRQMGCNELDMVINIAWLKAGEDDLVGKDIKAVVEAAQGIPVKVILECHHLTDEEIVRACEISVAAGVSFVKTGTGWAPSGATVSNTALMKRAVGSRCEVKAAGGVRDLKTLLAMHEVGVTRFGVGVHTAVDIFKEIETGEKRQSENTEIY